jgi:hypothetical protein
MALTRAQLLMGNAATGTPLLTGQVRGVKQGAGILIASNGDISVDASTTTGLVKLNNPFAYDAYVWPNVGGTAGQQLTSDGLGNLFWRDPDGIPWTQKGQLVVGTGVTTDTILNAGANTSFLVADTGSTSGLSYTDTLTSAALMPAGNALQRPNPATPGQIRYNTLTGKFEFATGATSWEQIASGDPAVSTFVQQTVPSVGSPSAVIPAGSGTQQQTTPAPLAGYLRFNTTTLLLEVFDGSTWTPAGAPPTAGLGINITGSLVKVAVPTASAPPAAGPGATQAVVGSMYWDDVLNQLFIYYSNGGSPVWVQAAPSASGGGGTVTTVSGSLPIVVATPSTTPSISINTATTAAVGAIQIATQAEAITGTDATKAATPATAVAKTTADLTGFIVTPSSAVAPATTGYLHYNTTSNHLEYFAASAAKTALEREGDNMTGKLSVTPSAITAGAGNWNLATSNYWTLGAVAVPLPTGMVAGQGGLVQVTAIPTSWPAAGGVLKYTGGTSPVIATVPAIIPYYSDGTNVYLGKATENIS